MANKAGGKAAAQHPPGCMCHITTSSRQNKCMGGLDFLQPHVAGFLHSHIFFTAICGYFKATSELPSGMQASHHPPPCQDIECKGAAMEKNGCQDRRNHISLGGRLSLEPHTGEISHLSFFCHVIIRCFVLGALGRTPHTCTLLTAILPTHLF